MKSAKIDSKYLAQFSQLGCSLEIYFNYILIAHFNLF